MHIVYTHEELPPVVTKSIFLAGPTPRSRDVQSWRPKALAILERLGYDGVVFVPEHRDHNRPFDYISQIEWEEYHLNVADCIVFWIPRNIATMPALTTNIEWGVWCQSGKAVLGAPPEAENVGYQKYYANKYKIPSSTTLEETLQSALEMIGEGAERTGGEREVPLHVWRDHYFQWWYKGKKQDGDKLEKAKVLLNFNRELHAKDDCRFALWVKVYCSDYNKYMSGIIILGSIPQSTILI